MNFPDIFFFFKTNNAINLITKIEYKKKGRKEGIELNYYT